MHSVKKVGSHQVNPEMNSDNGDNLPPSLPSLREEGEGCEDVESEGGDFNELNIEGALTDELKILQDRNDGLHQQIEVHSSEEGGWAISGVKPLGCLPFCS